MVFLDVQLNNIKGFNDFKINFSYPREIKNTGIPKEKLKNFNNFRYKKINIIVGANASGKTTFGEILNAILNFLRRDNIEILQEVVGDEKKVASIQVDFVDINDNFCRLIYRYNPNNNNTQNSYELYLEKILKNDSYETVNARINKKISENKIKSISVNEVDTKDWFFKYTHDLDQNVDADELYEEILNVILKSLDPAIICVKHIENDTNDCIFAINHKNFTAMIENNKTVENSKLSTGTIQGIKIASFIYNMITNNHLLYYCDELFSFTNSDFEKHCLAFMISLLEDDKQLFFTTHNSDILDMQLPLHSYIFLKKVFIDDEIINSYELATNYSKKNTYNLRTAIENDVFGTNQNVDYLQKLDDIVDKWSNREK